jgi:hypothetical protein
MTSDDLLRGTAFHEAGHVIVAVNLSVLAKRLAGTKVIIS